MPKLLAFLLAVALACATPLATAQGAPKAVAAQSVDIDPGANCISNANLLVSWTGAGNHFEYGLVTSETSGNTAIGTFGPQNSANDSFSGTYLNSFVTVQPGNTLIGSYAWVGANPPTAGSTVEYMVVYNCTTRAVFFKCYGPYGGCPMTAAAAIGLVTSRSMVPTVSPGVLIALMLVLAGVGAFVLRRRLPQSTPPQER
jgi:hypothetical protein